MEVKVDEVYADWLKAEGQGQIKTIATHYGIYEHLFGYAFFLPRVQLDIKVWAQSLFQTKPEQTKLDTFPLFPEKFEVDEETLAPVYFGNTLKPKHAKNAPTVSFDSTTKLLNNNKVKTNGFSVR